MAMRGAGVACANPTADHSSLLAQALTGRIKSCNCTSLSKCMWGGHRLACLHASLQESHLNHICRARAGREQWHGHSSNSVVSGARCVRAHTVHGRLCVLVAAVSILSGSCWATFTAWL